MEAYDEEEILFQKRIAELEETLTKSQEEELNVESFLKLVRKYTDIKELDPKIIRIFAYKKNCHIKIGTRVNTSMPIKF